MYLVFGKSEAKKWCCLAEDIFCEVRFLFTSLEHVLRLSYQN